MLHHKKKDKIGKVREVRWCRIMIFLTFIFFFPLHSLEVTELIEEVDRLFRSESSYAEMEMVIETPYWKRTLEMEVWTEGMDKTFITILSPKKDRGIKTLRISSQMWNYFPKIDKLIKVSPSMMMGSWMGSDFTNDDLVKENTFLEEYDAAFYEGDSQKEYWFVSLKPKEQTVTVWGEIRLVIRKEDRIPILQLYYDEHGELVKEMKFSDIQWMGGKKIPTRLEMTPSYEKGRKTSMLFRKISFDQGIPKETFTLRNLKRKHR